MQMDIQGILKGQAGELLNEELDMLAGELALGDYDNAYRDECQLLIAAERKKRKMAQKYAKQIARHKAKASKENEVANKSQLPTNVSGGVLVPVSQLSPFTEVTIPEKTPFEIVSADVSTIRKSEGCKSLFREYIKNQPLLNEQLIDANFSFFEKWELDCLLGCIQFSEAFLEKYISSLDGDRVARKQLFSEDFFMRHYAELDPELVLKRGKNPWRGKEDRSSKLDMFLRLKGVRF